MIADCSAAADCHAAADCCDAADCLAAAMLLDAMMLFGFEGSSLAVNVTGATLETIAKVSQGLCAVRYNRATMSLSKVCDGSDFRKSLRSPRACVLYDIIGPQCHLARCVMGATLENR